ncbi:hypothetical protein P152DRAFT_512710 [Eremomyces bilateralis CBS 781.70]|uniref:Uncharacterized protein n=1 Tax=Eremomyces bilateralis CBS 781.70 TaxID=1392243 RepID=A0A6G1G8K5_9PEZI|nr:uncharacterized protein P152DRAFT_512710 [Eremomyces bilateralis CBS 781.70]KAF1814322.1 hypothetical protein P152DRAFT_512710 [Eremomyces bilateralis CBS 781.70]
MADALCGPSNALQSFQKHAATDRTLQQDRLVQRHSPSQQQGFRSSPGPAGTLDPEFEAFQAGASPQTLSEASHFNHHLPPQHHAAPQSSLPGWASDFQNLTIGSAPPQFAPSHQAQSHVGQGGASWHQDFLQQQSGPSPQTMQPSQLRPSFSPMAHQPLYAPMYSPMNQVSEQPGKQRAEFYEENLFDDAAFERAFDDARAEISLGENVERELLNPDVTYDPVHDESIHDTISYLQNQGLDAEADYYTQYTPEELQRIEREHREKGQGVAEQQPQVIDDDALAQTAGQLLQSVSDNTSQKFQESNFLALMRKIRDKEIKVEGDHMVEVSLPSSPLSTTTVETPSTEFTPIPFPDPGMSLEWGLVSSSLSRPGSYDGHGMDVSGLNPAYLLHNHKPESVACKVLGCDGSAHCTYHAP